VIVDSRISQALVAGIMCYNKKSEYSKSSIEALNVHIEDTTLGAASQIGNTITLNGIKVKPTNMDIKELYRTVMKPGMK
ncbi:MAG: hypothetical protein OEM02_00155, partial [Desulfobulbaceae bacterium]|nr:hypothetical protein [Desulfobulbaceae bacterium]